MYIRKATNNRLWRHFIFLTSHFWDISHPQNRMLGSCINVTELLPITSTVSKTESRMYNTFFIHHINYTKFHLWYRVQHWVHRVIYWVQYDFGFPLHQSCPHLCLFCFVIIWAAPSYLTSAVTFMWLGHSDQRSSPFCQCRVRDRAHVQYTLSPGGPVHLFCVFACRWAMQFLWPYLPSL